MQQPLILYYAGVLSLNNKSFSAIAAPQHKAIKALLSILNNPQDTMRYIHVAGTNGKGSVCVYLQSILSCAGYKTGKFTSPHMLCERERITINENPIPENEFSRIMKNVKSAAKKIEMSYVFTITQFELWCACAFCYFHEQNCDYVVLETGLGGNKDATNIIKAPVLSVITRIALDHTELLGTTLVDIAMEKAGIIKNNSNGHTVVLMQDENVIDVISKVAKENKNTFDVVIPPHQSEFKDGCEIFSYKGISNIKSKMLGIYQIENACCAIECALLLGIDNKDILKGIYTAKNPGRFEILSKKPPIIFDGGHNQNGINALADSLNRYFPGESLNIIISFMHGKNIEESIDTLKQKLGGRDIRFYVVEVGNNPRAEKSNIITDILKEKGLIVENSKTLLNALKAVKSSNNLTVICGSLYLYSEFFEIKGNKI